jgi:hypothetical protein
MPKTKLFLGSLGVPGMRVYFYLNYLHTLVDSGRYLKQVPESMVDGHSIPPLFQLGLNT